MWQFLQIKSTTCGWATGFDASCPFALEVAQMTLNEYQQWQQTMAFYPQKKEFEGLVYTILAMGGEAGEVQNDLKKIIRDYKGIIVPETRQKLLYELGDVLWYISAATSELESSLQEIADLNISKLERRRSEDKPVG